MRTKIIGLFTAIILFSNISFANGIEPSEALQKEFNKEFAQSTDVEWEKVADFYKANFLMDGKFLTVYFDAFNNIESISRNISTSALPLILQSNMKDKLSETSWIADCFEIFSENGTEYFIVVENADQKVFYQATETDWDLYKRVDK